MLSRTARLITIQAIINSAAAIAGTFSLIYFVNLGYSYSEAVVYVLAAVGTTAALCPVLSYWGSMQPRYSIAAGSLAVGANYGLFLVLDGWALLVIPGVLFGAYMAFFWIPYNTRLLQLAGEKNRGFIIAFTFFIYPVIAVIMPIIGGGIIEKLDYSVVFAIALTILLANTVIALTSRDILRGSIRVGISIRSIGKGLSRALFFEGMVEGVHFFAIALLAFHFAEGEFKTGLLFSMFGLLGTAASMLVARISDRDRNRARWVRIGAIGAMPGMVMAGISEPVNSFHLFIVGMAIFNLFIPLVWVFLMSQAGDACGKRQGKAMLTRELLLNSGRAASATASVFLLFYMSVGEIFALSAIFLLPLLLLKNEK